MESAYQAGKIEKFLKISSASLFVLSAICFMIHTTGQSYTFAEGESDLGYDLASVDASVTVGTACTFTGTITSPHTASISNGISSDNIGTTILNTTCNDNGGYALYAIGYTDNEYGNTDLSSDISTTYNIPTGTATTGNTSNWSMKLNQVPGTTPATIENNYNNYNIVPDDYTKIATLNTVTDTPSTSTPTGSSVSTTYQTYISPTQPAGIYSGKVKYALVHPSTAPKPEKPVTIADAFKKSGATKTTQGYYKMQDMTPEINSNVNVIGNSLQVQDIRDDKIYWITKLADGNIWMTQNLDHNIVSTPNFYTYENTDIGHGSTPDTTATWTGTATYTTGTTTWDDSYTTPSSYDPGDLYWDGNVTTSGGTISDRASTTPPASGGTHYHIGNYYNWTAAVAMNDSSNYTAGNTDVNQSICPAGWMLPKSGTILTGSGSFKYLVDEQGLVSGTGTNANIQKAPAYFVYGGYWYGSSGFVGYGGSYWSSVVCGSSNSYLLYFNATGSLYPQNNVLRRNGYSLRCVAR